MKAILTALALACSCLFTAAPASAKTCTTNCFPVGETTYTMESGGLPRTYLVHVPQNYDPSKPTPLMLVMHGLGSNSEQIRDMGHAAMSDKYGYIAIFPQGYGNAWNGSACCVASDAVYRDDVAFLRSVIAEAKARANIDDNRVYAMGVSNGGAMAHRFGCEAADQVKAVIASAHRLSTPEKCFPARPVNVLEIDGLLDPLVDYYGLNVLGFVSAQTSFANWATINRCQGQVAVSKIERPTGSPESFLSYQPLPAVVPLSVSRAETFTNCAGGVRVTLVSIVTGTHTPEANLEGFQLNEYVWDYLKRLP